MMAQPTSVASCLLLGRARPCAPASVLPAAAALASLLHPTHPPTHPCACPPHRRGWRRSGRWVYYPLHECSCCQLLTIRLDVTKFQPSKDQVR